MLCRATGPQGGRRRAALTSRGGWSLRNIVQLFLQGRVVFFSSAWGGASAVRWIGNTVDVILVTFQRWFRPNCTLTHGVLNGVCRCLY